MKNMLGYIKTMNKFTLEIFIMFGGCLLIILSSDENSVNFYFMFSGLLLVIVSLITFTIKIKKNKGDYNDKKNCEDN